MRILYLDIDSLRPDHLGCYGYHRPTSPVIDQISREGMVFRNFFTSDAPCMPSRTAFYSGRFGIQSGVVGHGGSASQPKSEGALRNFRDSFGQQGLTRRLQVQGFHTALISPFAHRHSAHWFYAGFNDIRDTGRGGMESAEEITPFVDDWLSRNGAKDSWFLHVNFWDPHTPYRVPLSYGDPFKEYPLPDWIDGKILAAHQKQSGMHTPLDLNYFGEGNPRFPRYPARLENEADLRRMFAGYDTGVRYVDDHIGLIVEKLRALGIYDETAIIISADHGENLGELGIYGDHATADVATCRIPFIVKWPGGARGNNDRFHYNLDFAPTLMELLGGERQPVWDGESFARVLLNGDRDCGRDEVVFGQCAHVCQRSVRWDRWLYMHTYHDGLRAFPREMVFDLEADPHEQHDLGSLRPDLCKEGAWRLSRWHNDQMQKMASSGSDVVDSLWSVIKEGGPFHARMTEPGNPGGREGMERYIRHLKATGRVEAASMVRERLERHYSPPHLHIDWT